jgi:hypothetical protein
MDGPEGKPWTGPDPPRAPRGERRPHATYVVMGHPRSRRLPIDPRRSPWHSIGYLSKLERGLPDAAEEMLLRCLRDLAIPPHQAMLRILAEPPSPP